MNSSECTKCKASERQKSYKLCPKCIDEEMSFEQNFLFVRDNSNLVNAFNETDVTDASSSIKSQWLSELVNFRQNNLELLEF